MMFDVNNLFYYTGSFAFTAGNFVSLVGITGSGLASSVIDMTVAQDMGIGSGVSWPKVACYIGTGITSASTATLINLQFQGSTDSTNWTTYVETGPNLTASYVAGKVFPIDLPHRSQGSALPRYLRLNLAITGISPTSQTISAGTILAGLVMQQDAQVTYGSNFSAV